MHELGIAKAVLKAVQTEMLRYPEASPAKVCVRLGRMTAIDEQALRFCFEAVVRDTNLDGLELVIELCPLRYHCRKCGLDFEVENPIFECPGCASKEIACVGGDELELAYLEIEEHEKSAVGAQSTQ